MKIKERAFVCGRCCHCSAQKEIQAKWPEIRAKKNVLLNQANH